MGANKVLNYTKEDLKNLKILVLDTVTNKQEIKKHIKHLSNMVIRTKISILKIKIIFSQKLTRPIKP